MDENDRTDIPTLTGAPHTEFQAGDNGYANGRYARSLASFGTPHQLNLSKAWVLKRNVPGSEDRDAIGCYPLFAVPDWSKLAGDLATIGTDLVSLVVVTDPFGSYDQRLLQECFPDLVLPFKEHLVVDLDVPGRAWISRHHMRNVNKARARLQIDIAEPQEALNDWSRLYGILVERHAIRGMARFSHEAFALQMQVPGIVVLRAKQVSTTVGMLLWYYRNDIVYYHLGAYTADGYDLAASFALLDYAIDHFRTIGIRWLDLGGEAGISGSNASGLARFKRGWANTTRMAYLCGRVFDRSRYEQLVDASGKRSFEGQYFPAYRAGEFG